MSERPTDLELLRLREAQFTGGSAFDTGDPRQSPKILAERTGIGLVYLLEPSLEFRSPVAIERSDGAAPTWLREANPGNWKPVEWHELLDGQLGPWAIAVVGQQVLAICHTPIPMTEFAAEAGVWTEPRFRRQGHAVASTAAWAGVLRASERHLFYRVELDNPASMGVAERLGARLIGWTWDSPDKDKPTPNHVHPLCSLRR
jgi:hypothetical protein